MDWELVQPLMHHARYSADAIATSFEGRRTSWRDLQDRVARLAAALAELGVAAGDRVGILADNSDYYLESMLATWWSGAAINLINIRWSAAEIAFSLDDCDTRIIIVDSGFAHLVPDLKGRSASLATVIAVGGWDEGAEATYESLIDRHAPAPCVHREGADLAGVFYTGGTTGFPKGVMLSHTMLANNTLINLLEIPVDADDVVLAVAPLFHLAGMCVAMRAYFRGATCTFLRTFEERAFIDVAEREGATYTLLVPVMLQRLIAYEEDITGALAKLRLIQYGGAPIDETLLRSIIKRLPHVSLVQGYGMTETSGPYTVLPAWVHRDMDLAQTGRLRSAGRPAVGVTLRLRREDGSEAAIGEVGEVTCSGPIVMAGYWNQPEASAEVLTDGWMRSGDMGYVHEDGFLFLVDRRKDMIVSGGENVYSAEVENALAKHPAVAACAVIGIPSEKWGEQVHAVVVPHPGSTADPRTLREHCKQHIAGYKCPVSVEFREELPYTGTGKLQKNVLREPFWRERDRGIG